MAQPQINSVNIPYPSAGAPPERDEAYRGTGHEMADGSVVFQWVTTDRKNLFKLTWENISSTDLGTLRTAWKTVADNTTTTYKDVNGTTYNVTLDPQDLELHIKYAKAAGGVLRYTVNWTLREV